MDRKEIIERLRLLRSQIDTMWNGLPGSRDWISSVCANSTTEAADLLEVGGWVSVGERLPEYDKWIVARRRGRRPFTCMYIHVPDRFGGYAEFRDADGLVRDPTEWCRLPGGDHD